MHVVFDPTDDDRLAVESVKNAAKLFIQLFAQGAVVQKGCAVFGGENGMNEDFREGLGHGHENEHAAALLQPLQGWDHFVRVPRVGVAAPTLG